MTTLAFPASPTTGQTYTFNNKTWSYNGTGWAIVGYSAYAASPVFTGTALIGVLTPNASGGVLQLAGGITFPSTEVSSSDPNTLDDYEEGTWTPSSPTMSTVTTAKYTKIGRNVTIEYNFVFPTSGSGSAATFSGLPFSPASDTSIIAIGNSNYGSTYTPIGFYTAVGGTTISVVIDGVSGTATQANVSGIQVWGSFTYSTAT